MKLIFRITLAKALAASAASVRHDTLWGLPTASLHKCNVSLKKQSTWHVALVRGFSCRTCLREALRSVSCCYNQRSGEARIFHRELTTRGSSCTPSCWEYTKSTCGWQCLAPSSRLHTCAHFLGRFVDDLTQAICPWGKWRWLLSQWQHRAEWGIECRKKNGGS